MNLLNKAKKISPLKKSSKVKYNHEILELCLAWVNSEISNNQFMEAYSKGNYNSDNKLYFISNILREAVKREEIKIDENIVFPINTLEDE